MVARVPHERGTTTWPVAPSQAANVKSSLSGGQESPKFRARELFQRSITCLGMPAGHAQKWAGLEILEPAVAYDSFCPTPSSMLAVHENNRSARLSGHPREQRMVYEFRACDMKLSTQLTDHAKMRLKERTSLDESAFVAQLANYQTVSVGYRRGVNHWHRLFFSAADRCHFVAIQDISNGDIITILPLDYHENLAWRIDEVAKENAVYKASPEIHAELYPPPATPTRSAKMAITGVFAPKSKKENLGSYRFQDVPSSAAAALADDIFVSKLFQKLDQRGAKLEQLEEILLYNKKTGHFLKLGWHSIDAFALDFELQRAQPVPEIPTPPGDSAYLDRSAIAAG